MLFHHSLLIKISILNDEFQTKSCAFLCRRNTYRNNFITSQMYSYGQKGCNSNCFILLCHDCTFRQSFLLSQLNQENLKIWKTFSQETLLNLHKIHCTQFSKYRLIVRLISKNIQIHVPNKRSLHCAKLSPDFIKWISFWAWMTQCRLYLVLGSHSTFICLFDVFYPLINENTLKPNK